jgi:hypothetical protein
VGAIKVDEIFMVFLVREIGLHFFDVIMSICQTCCLVMQGNAM